jgi:arylsulfatase A-like enzyme
MKDINRRDVLKIAASLSLGAIGSPFVRFIQAGENQAADKKNILVVVFDSLSAKHISLYGYDRPTTPNLSRLADKAIVYHQHYAGGNFTTPGTASLLTGTLPWKHRAFGLYRDVAAAFADKSIFHAFDDYFRVAYSHNPLVVKLLDQFSSGLDNLLPFEKFMLTNDILVDQVLSKDRDIASVAWSRTIKQEEDYSYSLFLPKLYKDYQSGKIDSLKGQFPLGLPSVNTDNYFTLEMIMDWLKSNLETFPKPFLGYFHFFPPHYPYTPPLDFHNEFLNDGFSTAAKPEDIFTEGRSAESIFKSHQEYDEFILYVDREFGKLFDHMEDSGILENTWVVFTSDHGELFERGVVGHVTPLLYEPVIHIPLLIFEPGRTTRLDIQSKTSAVDVLPTLLHVTAGRPADWTDGLVLPPFSQGEEIERNIFALHAKNNDSDAPLTKFTLTAVKENYKLIYYTGYKKLGGSKRIELYNLDLDPEELENIYTPESVIGNSMLEELKARLHEIDKPYLFNADSV